VNDLALDYGSKPIDASSRRVGSYLMWVAIMTTCVTSSLFLTAAPAIIPQQLRIPHDRDSTILGNIQPLVGFSGG
jgi:di/tricarboxylate transporter